MRVVLDAFWWARGTQSLKNVVHGMVEAWMTEFPQDEIVVVVPRADRAVAIRDLPTVRVVTTRLWPQALSAFFAVPCVGRRVKADLVLAHNFSPLYGRARGVLIHDVMFETSPEWFSKKELLYYRWMTRSARRSHVVFSTTDTEGRRLRSFTKARSVVTAGMGITADLVAPNAPRQAFDKVVAGRYMLTVGRLNVRKNLATLLEGARESGVLSPNFPLVIAGERDGAWSELPPWVKDAAREGSVIFAGFLPVAQLRWLIQCAALYLCMSLDEGFGLPPVEARILGARVLVSDIPVFRETLAGHATYVDPLDARAIGEAVQTALRSGSPTPNDEASEELVARHTWSGMVRTMRAELVAARAERP